jgi:pimeloyl-ACP methyl ester carboxylesterase
MFKSNYLSILLAGLLISCNDDGSADRKQPEKNVYYVSSQAGTEISKESLQLVASATGLSDFNSLIQYGVKTYTLVYKTTYKGNEIEASGVIYIPQGIQGEAPLLSLQHGTTFVKDDVPSASGIFTGMEFFAAAGYISLMPDFIGFGKSSETFHPYYVKEPSASAVVDMIKAAKEFLSEKQIAFNDKLFLAGYSEGGYVTMAAAKAIEDDPAHALTVTAIAAGAGGYDLSSMMQSIATSNTYAYPAYLAYVLVAYNKHYEWNHPMSYYFNQPYADTVSRYLNGSYSGSFINSRLTTSVEQLLSNDFYDALKDPSKEQQLKEALAENSVAGWKTHTPIQLYHGTNDEIIPYHNSEVTLQHFLDAGSDQITLTPIPGGTHGSSFIPMLKGFVPWFENFRK